MRKNKNWVNNNSFLNFKSGSPLSFQLIAKENNNKNYIFMRKHEKFLSSEHGDDSFDSETTQTWQSKLKSFSLEFPLKIMTL